jgi:hypothetical protein
MDINSLEALAKIKTHQLEQELSNEIGFALLLFNKDDAKAGGEIEYTIHSHCEDMTIALVDFLKTWRRK